MQSITRTFIFLAFLLLAIFIAHYQTSSILLERWLTFDESLSHGLLVVVMTTQLIAKSLHNAPHHEVKTGQELCFLLAIFLSVCWAAVSSANIDILQQVLLPAIAWSLLSIIFGFRIAISLLAPVAFLYFSVPIWDYSNNVLVDLSSIVVGNLVELSGITAYLSGAYIQLPYGTLLIAGGCSGLRYLVISLALSCYLSLDGKGSLKTKLFIILIAALSALIANWVRIFWIVIAADQSNMQSSLIEDHEYFGWGVFAVLLAPSMILGSRLLPAKKTGNNTPMKNLNVKGLILAGLSLALAQPILSYFSASLAPVPELRNPGYFSSTLSTWNIETDSAYDRYFYANETLLKSTIILNSKQLPNEKLVPYISQNSPLKKIRCKKVSYFVSGRWTNSYSKAKLLQMLPTKTHYPVFAMHTVYALENEVCNTLSGHFDLEEANVRALVEGQF